MSSSEKLQFIHRILNFAMPKLRSKHLSIVATVYHRPIHIAARPAAFAPWSMIMHSRPMMRPFQPSLLSLQPTLPAGRRTIFIQTENTPNPDVSISIRKLANAILILEGAEIHSEPSYITAKLILNLSGVFVSKIYFGCSPSFASCRTIVKY